MGEDMTANEGTQDEVRAKVASAMRQLPERVHRDGLEVVYARESDHLYVAFGPPSVTLSIPAENPIDSIVLYDPDSYEVLGIEVPAFMEKYRKGVQEEFWHIIASHIKSHRDNVYIPGGQESQRTENAVGDLVFAPQ